MKPAFTLLLLLATSTLHGEDAVSVGDAVRDENGFLVHEVQSPFQSGTTLIRVLRPDGIEEDRKYPVVYLLPVEAGSESRYGNGLEEVRKLGLHNSLRVIFVAPTFSQLPWYADHPTRPEIRQESYFLKVVVPFIDKNYPVRADAEGRLLLGFSKSGWGAWSLMLRHPEMFGRAVAWDAPLMMDLPGKYGSGEIFSTEENFRAYQISRLLEEQAETCRKEQRLILLGYGNFRTEHEQAHALLNRLKIPHIYRDGPPRKHDWHSGWVQEAAGLLVGGRPEAP